MSNSTAKMTGVWGVRGSGKSSFMKHSLKGINRVIVLDTQAEYGEHGFKTVHSVNAAKDAIMNNPAGFRVAVVPRSGTEAIVLNQICDLLHRVQAKFFAKRSKAEATLVVEEMNSSFSLHRGVYDAPEFAEVCSRGRHYGINVYGLSQRIAEVSTRFRDNCDDTILLRQVGGNSIKAAANQTGASVDQIKEIRKFHYLLVQDSEISHGETKK